MPWYRMPGGAVVHLKLSRGRRKPPPRCGEQRDDGTVCGWMAGFQCDWKIGDGKTCDRWICEGHAQEVAPDKHLCPEHQMAYKSWLQQREKASLTPE